MLITFSVYSSIAREPEFRAQPLLAKGVNANVSEGFRALESVLRLDDDSAAASAAQR